jgi:outer membrane protein assembly factor BamB
VHITAVCPACQSSYQLEESLRGQTIRCPNPQCRKPFTVAANGAPAEPAARSSRGPRIDPAPPMSQRSGSVGDLVPILPAEPLAALPPSEAGPDARGGQVGETVPLLEAEGAAPAGELPAWMQPPPVRRSAIPTEATPPEPATKTRLPRKRKTGADTQPSAPMAEQTPAPETAVRDSAVPTTMAGSPQTSVDDTPAPTWEPPPVRRPAAHNGDATPAAEAPAPAAPDAETPPPPPNRMARRMVAALVVVVAAMLGTGGYLLWYYVLIAEGRYRNEAEEFYKTRQFANAREKYLLLGKEFPQSEKHDEDVFLAELCDLRAALNDNDANLRDCMTRTLKFIDEQTEKEKSATFLKAHAPELGEDYAKLVVEYTKKKEEAPEADDRAVVEQYRKEFAEQLKASLPEALTPAQWDVMNNAIAGLDEAIDRRSNRDRLLATMAALKRNLPPADAIKRITRILKREATTFPDLDQDRQVIDLLNSLYERHRASVVYETVPPGAERRQPPPEGGPPSIWFDPELDGLKGSSDPDERIVLALDRGVLYGLKRNSGAVRWARRVGIDTRTLPVRVPPSPGNEERILVLSTDARTLTALNTRGRRVWTYALTERSLGRPVVVEGKAYLATFDGKVHVVELAGGHLLGRFHLGQALTAGGTRHPRDPVIYFPADDTCVYELDVKANRCKAILYSWHPAGTLRGEPIVVAPPRDQPGDSYLILNQTAGLDGVRLRVFRLPLTDRDTTEIALNPAPALRGWTWFAPRVDGEKLTLLSDAGRFGLFGINQPRNHDNAVFPLLPDAASRAEGLDLTPYLGADLPKAHPGRSQVVQVQDNDFWVLAYGRLQRLHLDLTFRDGPRVSSAWGQPSELGSPLHASQVVADRLTGRATLYLTTQALDRSVCRATAVDDEDGDIVWQRQLGVVARGTPLTLTPPADHGDAGPLLLVQDQGGGLFALDPSRYPGDEPWRGSRRMLAPSLPDNPALPPMLLAGRDGRSAYQVACPGRGDSLVIRYVGWDEADKQWVNSSHTIKLSNLTLAGTPGVVGKTLVLPMSDGVLHRLDLTERDRARVLEDGPQWRSPLVRPEARGHVLGLDAERFLTTDGGRILICIRWPLKQENLRLSVHQLGDRIVAAPLLLPGAEGGPAEVCVADAGGVVTLLTVDREGKIEGVRKWDLGGPITTAPWVASTARGHVRLACVVDKSKLVWLDPKRDEPLWDYSTKGGAAIVDRPHEIEGLVVVADQSGRVVGLEPDWWPLSGLPIGDGYELSGSVVAASSPVAFGPGRLLVPLTDGTMIILKREQLR